MDDNTRPMGQIEAKLTEDGKELLSEVMTGAMRVAIAQAAQERARQQNDLMTGLLLAMEIGGNKRAVVTNGALLVNTARCLGVMLDHAKANGWTLPDDPDLISLMESFNEPQVDPVEAPITIDPNPIQFT